jgi:hypothetical protein
MVATADNGRQTCLGRSVSRTFCPPYHSSLETRTTDLDDGMADQEVTGKTPSDRPADCVTSPNSLRSLELSTLAMEAGLTWDELQTFLGRTTRTLRRWKTRGLPAWARNLLRLRAGYLDGLGWKGWRLVDGELYAPDLAHGFRQKDLYRAHWDRQRLRDLENNSTDIDQAYQEYQGLLIFKHGLVEPVGAL